MSATLDELVPPGPTLREISDTGVRVHPLALDGSIFGWAAGDAESRDVLDRFTAAGGNLVSTADHYAAGRSELMIGSWLREQPDRSRVIIATKIGRHPDASGLAQGTVRRAVEASLRRLGTDYIDFLSFDGDHPETPIEDALEAVDRLIREGKVRFLGASGYSVARLREIGALAAQSAYPRFRAFVVEYNLMDRDAYERGLQQLSVESGRATLARLPLASGYLTGRYRTRDDVPESVMFGGAIRHIGRRGNRVLEALDRIAKELGSSPTQVALAWVLLKPGVAAAVLRARDGSQLDECFAAPTLGLARHHMVALDNASAG